MNSRLRNITLSLIAAFAGLLVASLVVLLVSATATDYTLVGYGMYGVSVLSVIIVILITMHDKDNLDRVLVGFMFGGVAVISLISGLGVHFHIFSSANLAQKCLIGVTGLDALVTSGYWFYTALLNKDFN